LDEEFYRERIGKFVHVDFYSDKKKAFAIGVLHDVVDHKLHLVPYTDDGIEAFVDISEIINIKFSEVKNHERER
jgi:hypothetical protein